MGDVPLWLRLVVAVVLVGTMVLAFWGRPPSRRPRPATWRRLAGAGAVCYCAGCAALLADEPALSAALVGVGVETLSVVAWLGRGLGGEDDDGGGGGGEPDDPDDRNCGGDGEGPPEGWKPADEREFWDYVSRGGSPREPVAR